MRGESAWHRAQHVVGIQETLAFLVPPTCPRGPAQQAGEQVAAYFDRALCNLLPLIKNMKERASRSPHTHSEGRRPEPQLGVPVSWQAPRLSLSREGVIEVICGCTAKKKKKKKKGGKGKKNKN